jgi:predicted RND superfamily exporter protein
VGVSASAARRSLLEEQSDENDPEHRKHPVWAFLDLFTQRRWAVMALVAALGLAAVGFGVGRGLKIGDLEAGAPELRADSRYNRDNAYLAEHYAASSDAYVVMVKTQAAQCNSYKVLAAIDALEWELQQIPEVESTKSFAGFAKQASVGMNEGSYAWYDLPRNQGMLNSVANRGSPRELINQNCDLVTLYAYLKDHKAETLQQVVKVVSAYAAKHNDDDVQFLSAAGNAGIEAATNIVVREADRTILWLVYAAVTVLAYVTFRSVRAVACAIVPLIVTTLLAEALMVVLGIGVKVATLPVIALGVGIGVDYALYVLSVVLAEMRAGRTLSQAYYTALKFTGKVVILTGLTLSLAVFIWVWSPIKFQADMGVLLAFMFLWNMLGALILLPALAHFLLRPQALPQALTPSPQAAQATA